MGEILDGVEFVASFMPSDSPEKFSVLKSVDSRERYMERLRRHSGARMVELGIYSGGSTAMAMLVADPLKLVAIDISEPVEALETFRHDRGLADRLRTHYRCDQSDRVGLTRILDEEFGDEPLDLVIDDASHKLAETLASFEVIFPRLRPGGEFVIEDWTAGPIATTLVEAMVAGEPPDEGIHVVLLAAAAQTGNPLNGPATLALQAVLDDGGVRAERARELMETYSWEVNDPEPSTLASIIVLLASAMATRPGEIERFDVNADLVTIVRGPAELPRTGWTLERAPGEALLFTGLA